MVAKDEATSGIAFVLRRLTETMAENDRDGGKTYDRMAENIRRESGSGLVREALGYVPTEAEDISACDSFRPIYRVGKEGRRAKKLPSAD
jgi:hypothetical protein